MKVITIDLEGRWKSDPMPAGKYRSERYDFWKEKWIPKGDITVRPDGTVTFVPLWYGNSGVFEFAAPWRFQMSGLVDSNHRLVYLGDSSPEEGE